LAWRRSWQACGLTTPSVLLGFGAAPATASACLAEFFVTATITGTFVLTIRLALWPIIAGPILGGVLLVMLMNSDLWPVWLFGWVTGLRHGHRMKALLQQKPSFMLRSAQLTSHS
jgi:hypothetical protein